MRKVLMTGGTGFIGSWLLQELVAHQNDVTLLVRNPSRVPKQLIDSIHTITYVPETIEQLDLPNCKYDVFYHMGWGGVSPEQKNDAAVQLSNVRNSVSAMRFAARMGCSRFIAAGTVAEYVFCDGVMDISGRQSPNDLYGAAKTSTCYFLDVISRQLNLPLNWVILPSTFGERRTDNNIVTYTIRTLLAGEKPLYGNLMQKWDFLYVSEVARALRLIGECGVPGKSYGIGSGIYRPLREYVECIRDLIDPSLPLGIGEINSLSTNTFSSCVDIAELTQDTGFVPSVSFDSGIRKTIDWMRKSKKN